jgi:hypothetical protein
MAVKPHKKLVDYKKNKNIVGNHPGNPQRNSAQRQVGIQKIFLFDEALKPGSEGFYQMVFFQVIELVDNTTSQNGKNGTKNNTVHFEIKYEISERFILIEQEKSGNIEGKCQQGSYKKTCSEQKAHKL